MAAFAAAIDLGYRYLETDVHATADGVLVAFHDDRLERVTDRSGSIAELPWSEVATARLGGREPIVRFADLLAAWPAARINVDPKHDAAVGPLVAAIREARALDRVCVGSFSTPRLQAIRAALGPDACTSLTAREALALRIVAWGVRPLEVLLRRSPGLCLQAPIRGRGVPFVDERSIRAAHRLGLPVHVWTVNEPDVMESLLDLGVDGLMTDRPRVLRAVLERRGLWRAA
jgi:glycerophosphoryl diester phosphodiesterase